MWTVTTNNTLITVTSNTAHPKIEKDPTKKEHDTTITSQSPIEIADDITKVETTQSSNIKFKTCYSRLLSS